MKLSTRAAGDRGSLRRRSQDARTDGLSCLPLGTRAVLVLKDVAHFVEPRNVGDQIFGSLRQTVDRLPLCHRIGRLVHWNFDLTWNSLDWSDDPSGLLRTEARAPGEASPERRQAPEPDRPKQRLLVVSGNAGRDQAERVRERLRREQPRERDASEEDRGQRE